MEIREYNPSDKDAVIKLLRLNTPEYFSPDEESDLSYYLDHEIEYYYVAESASEIVSCGGVNLSEDGDTAKLSWDIVHPDYQGKGIGTQITRHRISVIKQMKNIRKISVRTSQFVYPFYEKFGLILREIKKDFWAEGYDMYRLDNDTCLVVS